MNNSGTQVICHSVLHTFLFADPQKTSGVTMKREEKMGKHLNYSLSRPHWF